MWGAAPGAVAERPAHSTGRAGVEARGLGMHNQQRLPTTVLHSLCTWPGQNSRPQQQKPTGHIHKHWHKNQAACVPTGRVAAQGGRLPQVPADTQPARQQRSNASAASACGNSKERMGDAMQRQHKMQTLMGSPLKLNSNSTRLSSTQLKLEGVRSHTTSSCSGRCKTCCTRVSCTRAAGRTPRYVCGRRSA